MIAAAASLYRSLVYRVANLFEAEAAHSQALRSLAWAQSASLGRAILRLLAGRLPAQPVERFGLRFPNRLGVAAGYDKDGRIPAGLARLGFGHLEIGTLTPRPQAGNEQPRLFRLPQDEALINRLGFPNGGAEAAAQRLARARPAQGEYVLGVSLGKQEETPLAEAAADYVACLQAVFAVADYVALNISSPNTPGLRELQGRSYLDGFLAELMAANRALAQTFGRPPRPLLLKVSPDLSAEALEAALDCALRAGLSGLIATNTTTDHSNLTSRHREQSGGVSGRPLAARSNAALAFLARHAGGRLALIGVGGVSDADDVRAKLDCGADLVQIYTALVYHGPALAGRILRQLDPDSKLRLSPP
ncbi:MAG: quinone-dependent dihydroorotate dehydrogenase [Candidatus Promineifilaceae bacterium]